MLEALVDKYENILFTLAEMSAGVLELIGIVIIIIGAFRALIKIIRNFIRKKPFVNDVDLEKALSLSLEFKMGAEIIKTVIIDNLEELAILGVVIIIRALIALLDIGISAVVGEIQRLVAVVIGRIFDVILCCV